MKPKMVLVHDEAEAVVMRREVRNANLQGLIQVRVSGALVQIRFPRSKRKRIRKKWAKKSGNLAWQSNVPKGRAVIVDNSAFLLYHTPFQGNVWSEPARKFGTYI